MCALEAERVRLEAERVRMEAEIRRLQEEGMEYARRITRMFDGGN